jgi:hypothetical protein
MKRILSPPSAFVALSFLAIAAGANAASTSSDAQAPIRLKTEHFDSDPGWDNSVNRVEATNPPTITQDFGWSAKKIGGTVHRSMTPAWYGMALEQPLSFKDAFSASGKISSTPAPEKGGVAYLGFFNHERQGWRPWASMAMRLKNAKTQTLIYLDYMTGRWNAGAAEMEYGIPCDGTEHTWSMTYDPNATRAEWMDLPLRSWLTPRRQTVDEILAKGQKAEPGLTREALETRLRAALREGLVSSLARRRTEYWLLKQDTKNLKGAVAVQVDSGEIFRTYLDADLRDTPVVLDRFGIFNMQLPGGSLSFHISDLTVNGQRIDLSKDPGWESHGNRAQFVERDFVRQNFGYSETDFSGGGKGEIGGMFYNVEPVNPLHGYYADDVGRLTLDDPIHFSGKITFIEGSTDAGMFFGFFRAEDEKRVLPPNNTDGSGSSGWPQPNVLGVVVDGPARIGWYFAPTCTAVARSLSTNTMSTVFLPTRAHRTFTFDYDPQANQGLGRATVTLDGVPPILLDLTREQRQAGATFDHFGLTSFRRGGKFSILYFDDLTYSTRRSENDSSLRYEQKVTTVPFPR